MSVSDPEIFFEGKSQQESLSTTAPPQKYDILPILTSLVLPKGKSFLGLGLD